MFTGIIEGTGVITAATADEGGRRLRIEPPAAINALFILRSMLLQSMLNNSQVAIVSRLNNSYSSST